MILVTTLGFLEKGYACLKIDPDFVMPIIKKARLGKLLVISAHSHPFSDSHVAFSSIDDCGDELLMPKIQQRVPDRPYAVISIRRIKYGCRNMEGRRKRTKTS